jgi:hypothetical protein
MRVRWQRLWPWAKLLLAVAIVGGVGWQFATLLRRPELWDNPPDLRPGWLMVCMAIYMMAWGFPGFYWLHLLGVLGPRPPVAGAARAYFVGHLGKYVPGKAWALVLRTTLVHPYGVRPAVAVMTAVYETMTFMTSGALVAVVLLSIHALEESDRWKALVLLALAGVPILPGVFNRIVDGLTALARRAVSKQGAAGDIADLPRLRTRTMIFGLALTAWGWGAMGLSLWAVMQAVLPEPPGLTWSLWGRCTAFVAMAYVAGFLVLLTPGGLGVRDLFLQELLTPEFAGLVGGERAASFATVVVLVLRLFWTVAEVIAAAVTYVAARVLAGAPAKPQAATPESWSPNLLP